MLRLRKLWKCYDMSEFGKYRYKIMSSDNHWLPGGYAFNAKIQNIDYTNVPESIPLKEMLLETHRKLYQPEFKLLKKIKYKIKKINEMIKN